jgi:phosphate transport system substrate-binding protein
MLRSLKSVVAAAGLAAVLASSSVVAADVTGAGASFVFPVMSKWSAEYAKAGKDKINYQSIGSAGGIAQIKSATVDFGSSDAPMSPEDLKAGNLGQFPSVIGGVVPAVNLAGIETGKINFTGPLLADIFQGKITKWNDKAIAEVNPGVTLPDQNITVVHRSDGSGTTFNFVNYLSKVSEDWKKSVGEGTSVKWPVGIGGKGNEGVGAYVKQIKGSIGYLELSYAVTNHLVYGAVKNSAGKFIVPSAASFQAAAKSAEWAKAQDFFLVITNAPGDDSYPIAATNFIIMSKQPKDAAKSKSALEFFRWAYASGDQAASDLGYVPLPDELVKQVDAYWAANFKF